MQIIRVHFQRYRFEQGPVFRLYTLVAPHRAQGFKLFSTGHRTGHRAFENRAPHRAPSGAPRCGAGAVRVETLEEA